MKVDFVDFGAQYREHKEEYDEAISKCLESGRFILQKELEEFEENLAKFLGVKYVVGVASGSDALFLGLKAKGVERGQNLVVSAYTFKATHEAVLNNGGKVVFSGVVAEGFTEYNCIYRIPTPISICHIPVHIEGMIAKPDKKHLDKVILEDAAQAIGAKGVGYSGTACYSFYPAKILGGIGDGGAVATNDKEVADKVRLYRHHWQTGNNEKSGYTSRLDNINAAFLNVKLKYLPAILKRREEIAMKYKALEGYVGLPFYQEGRVWQDYVITTPDSKGLADFLADAGIQTLGQGMKTPEDAFGYTNYDTNTRNLYKQMLRLPCNETLTDEQVDYVIEKVKEYVSAM